MTKKDKRFKLRYTDDGCKNDTEVEFGVDGHIHFCGEDAYSEQVYLYPKQVEKLIALIKENDASIIPIEWLKKKIKERPCKSCDYFTNLLKELEKGQARWLVKE